jgi:predicted Zn-dependent protease
MEMGFPSMNAKPFFLLLAMTCAGVSARAQATPPPPEYTSLRVVVAGNVSTTVVQRVVNFTRTSFPLKSEVETVAPAADTDLASAAKLGGTSSNDFIKIVLFDAAAAELRHGIYDPTNRVMVLNTTALRHEKEESFARRLDRQFTRGVCFSLGMPTCPNPMCGLFPYKDLAELDMVGRGACPPCHFKAVGLAKEKHVHLEFPKLRPRIPSPAPVPAAVAPPAPAPQP